MPSQIMEKKLYLCIMPLSWICATAEMIWKKYQITICKKQKKFKRLSFTEKKLARHFWLTDNLYVTVNSRVWNFSFAIQGIFCLNNLEFDCLIFFYKTALIVLFVIFNTCSPLTEELYLKNPHICFCSQ